MVSKYLLACVVLAALFACDFVSSVAIYKDTDVIKKSHRTGKQLNDIPLYDDDYSPSRMNREESRWESAEWPKELSPGGRHGHDTSYESEERPYNWYYYNKFITNGRFNHLYNGPHLDNRAGIGDSGNRNQNAPPRILPRPLSSYGRSNKNEFLT